MKQYTIGLTLLFALVNTGCEDAKAETKDYDTEIAELKSQINALNEKIDAMPKTTHYEGVVGSDNILTIDIPGFDPNEDFTHSTIASGMVWKNNKHEPTDKWRQEFRGAFESDRFVYDRGPSNTPEGLKIRIAITK